MPQILFLKNNADKKIIIQFIPKIYKKIIKCFSLIIYLMKILQIRKFIINALKD